MKLKNFCYYVLFAGLATIIDWSTFYILVKSFDISYLISVFLSYSLGIIANFSLNKYFNFKNKYPKVLFQLIIFIIGALGGLFITFILMILLIQIVGINEIISRMIATFIILFYSYAYQKNVTFSLFS